MELAIKKQDISSLLVSKAKASMVRKVQGNVLADGLKTHAINTVSHTESHVAACRCELAQAIWLQVFL
jgi:hypothetical protein